MRKIHLVFIIQSTNQQTLFLHLFLFLSKERNVISSFDIPMMKNDNFL